MISGLGRYEFSSGSSNKFWHIYLNKASGTYITEWGKIGYPPQGRKDGLSESEARKKINEKINKGYQHVGGFTSTKQAEAISYNHDDDRETVKPTVHVSVGKRKLDL